MSSFLDSTEDLSSSLEHPSSDPQRSFHMNVLSRTGSETQTIAQLIPSASQDQQQHRRSLNWTTEWITNWWGLEILSWFFAIISLIAIVITLKVHDGKPLPDWPFDITLNALVSIFATIGEMAMMKPVTECLSQLKWLWFGKRKRPLPDFVVVDDASRGHLGSLKLLVKQRGLHLASLGAAITLITLAFGPFTQQVLTYPSKSSANGVASAPQVIRYTAATDLRDSGLGLNMLSAVYDGLSATSATFSSVSTICSTGNCTFPIYSSLGVCATVVDVSEYLSELPCQYSSAALSNFEAGVISAAPCFNYTLLGAQSNITFSSTGDSNGSPYLQLNISQGLLGHPSTPGLTLADFFVLYQPLLNISANPNILDLNATRNLTKPPTAFECKLSFCAQTYTTAVNSTITSTTLNATEMLNYTVPPGDNITVFDNVTAIVNGTEFSATGAEVYFEVWQQLEDFFLGSCDASLTTTDIHRNPELGCYWYSDHTSNSNLNGALWAVAQAINKTSDPILALENVMNNLSITMTNTLREGAGGDVTLSQVSGTAYSTEPHVHAEYLWLILPISLMFLTLIFLITTISKSRKAKIDIWKSSSLAALQGLNPDLRRQLGGLHAMDRMEEAAEGLVVGMERGRDDGWGLMRT